MTTPQPVAISPHRIPVDTRPAYVQLKAADLENQLAFYQQVLGLRLHWREDGQAGLGAGGPDLLRLVQIPGGKRYRGVTGLYHFAVLFPDRSELARAMARLFAANWPNAPTDHLMTKTTYLEDPEGTTVELYCESPEDGIFMMDPDGSLVARHADGRPSDGREPLDVEALFRHLPEGEPRDQPVPPETRIGHFHLYVADLQATRRFYHEGLGFDDMGLAPIARMGMVSAGGYHHHIGYNTWQGQGAPPPPDDAVGLDHIAFTLSGPGDLDQLESVMNEAEVAFERRPDGLWTQDPSQNSVRFATGELADRRPSSGASLA
jgi:catechol 2,3-dioxygenase